MDVISSCNLPWVPITCSYLGHRGLNLCRKIEKGNMLLCQTTDRTSVGVLVVECVGFYENVFETLCDFYSPKLIPPQYCEISWLTQHWSEGFAEEPECGLLFIQDLMKTCRSLFSRTDKWKVSHTKGFTGFLCADNTTLSVVFWGGRGAQCSGVFWISKETLLVTNSCWHYRQWIMGLMKGCVYLRTGTEGGYQQLHMSADFSWSLRTMKT